VPRVHKYNLDAFLMTEIGAQTIDGNVHLHAQSYAT